MADLTPRPADPPPNEALQKEAKSRLADAKQSRAPWENDFREAYFFTAPHRLRPGDGRLEQKRDDASELQTSLGFEVSEDFSTMLLNSFVPQTEVWCELSGGPDVQEGQVEQIKAACDKATKAIFKAISASNFYTEFSKAAFPDGGIGTMAMQIMDPGQGRPLSCLAASLREIYTVLGPDGCVDDRWIVRSTKNRYLRGLIPGAKFTEAISSRIKDKPGDKVEVAWGYWRDWSADEETWQHAVTVNGTLVHDARLVGQGCCVLVIGRFNATSDTPWGYGPTIKALPDLRQVDELSSLKIEGIDFNTRPPSTFPADSMTALEGGVEPGMFYPVRPGDEGAVKEMFRPGNLDGAMYEISLIEERVRRLHFLDTPTQRGKTPPSATQWAGELEMAQRRIGTPGLSFWSEMCVGVFARFKYLLEARGTIQPIKVDGRSIAVFPVNPAQRAADMLKVEKAVRLIEIGSQGFQEEFKVRVDGGKTLMNLKAKLNDDIVEMRSEDDIAAAVAQIQPLIGGGQAPPNIGQAPPGAPPA